MFLLMFVSPIAFEPRWCPRRCDSWSTQPGVYLIEAFRDCLIAGRQLDPRVWAIQAVLSLSALRRSAPPSSALQERPGRLRIMCGMAGVLAFDRGDTRVPTARHAMRECVAHRGPDGGATWVDADGRIGLGHRRLSIIDLAEQPSQPMANEDGSLWIIFNGEIYNHAELRRELRRRTPPLAAPITPTPKSSCTGSRSGASTRSRGCAACLRSRCGTRARERCGSVRDRIGVKPLYYSRSTARLTFASEIKALLEVPGPARARSTKRRCSTTCRS